ncbi:imidazole glycerol phosphate synthase subunit HisH [Candidatus Vidania fulgoroideorum]
MNIGIVNIGYGNLFSIYNSFRRITKKDDKIFFICEIKDIFKADKIIFPGNGSIIDCFMKIKKLNFLFSLRKYLIENSIPFLGICLGKQILFNFNYEGYTNGLGIFKGNILRIKSYKIPHIGWNKITILKKHKLIKKIKKFIFYFSHSFYLKVKKNTYSKTSYSNNVMSSIYIYKNFFLLQFHPEKSSYEGIKIIKNFLYDNTCFRYL